jgi:di/tricarboxylate transporter
MGFEAWVTLAVVATTITLLLVTQRAPDLIVLGAVTVLLVLGVLDTKEALGGFANEGMITVGALFIVAAGVERTGVMTMLVDRVMGRPKSLLAAQLRCTVPPALLSAFMNNTPLVAMMVPVIRAWTKRNRFSLSRLLLPMNNAVVLGGLCTLIGTSTNVVVSGLLRDKTGHGFDMFELTWVGLPCAVLGITFMLMTSRWLLPDRKPVLSEEDDPRAYTVEMMVEPGSALVGSTIEGAGLRRLPGMYLMEIDRDGQTVPAVAPTERLRPNDRLVFVGIVESVVDLQKVRGLRPATDQVFKLNAPRAQRRLIEAVVSNSCWLIGKTIREAGFRTIYNAAVIAVGRNGERLRAKVGDIELKPGDMLLIEGPADFVERQRNSRDFFLLSEIQDSPPPEHDKAWVAGLILATMVVAATFEVTTMLNAALVAAAAILVTGCLSPSQARRSLEWETLLLIAGSFAIARAMEKTGTAATLAQTLIHWGGQSPRVSLAMVYVVAMLFTELMSNNAAAVLVFPIGWATAANLAVNPMPFVVAVTIAASCGFATPMGYQTNMMVYGPGGYRFGDYTRFGGPLNVIVAVVTITLAPLIWPF